MPGSVNVKEKRSPLEMSGLWKLPSSATMLWREGVVVDPLDGRAGGDLERALAELKSAMVTVTAPLVLAATVSAPSDRAHSAAPATASTTTAAPMGTADRRPQLASSADAGDERRRQGQQADDLGDEGDRCLR